jgi:hypothetical protein
MWLESSYRLSRLSVKDVENTRRISAQIDNRIHLLASKDEKFSRSNKTCAFVTVASPSYDFGLKVLLSSIRRHSGIPVIVLASQRWEFKTDVPDVHLIEVPSLFNERYNSHRPELGGTLTKLWIFGLLSLDRIVFLDADCLVLKPIDDLFDWQGFCCAPDFIENSDAQRFNSGVMAFDPSKELRDLIYEKAYATESYDHGDQGLLNNLLRPLVRLIPVEYNLTRLYALYRGPDTALSAARVIHYIVKKPWEMWYRETPDVALLDLDAVWTEQLSHADLLELVSMWRRRQFIAERPRFESLRSHGPAQTTWASLFMLSRRFRLFVVAAVGVFLSVLLCFAVAVILTLAHR